MRDFIGKGGREEDRAPSLQAHSDLFPVSPTFTHSGLPVFLFRVSASVVKDEGSLVEEKKGTLQT